jgi:hypothetical protein
MQLAIYFSPFVNFILCIIGVFFGIAAVVSGFKKENKSYLYLSGVGRYIKNPTLNILWGIVVIVACIYGLIKNGALL